MKKRLTLLQKIVQVPFVPYLFFLALGSLIAYLAWSSSLKMVSLSALLFIAYLLLNNRSHLFSLVVSYYLIGSRGLLLGTQNYYDSQEVALGIWLSAALLSSIVWIGIWSTSATKRLYLFPLMITLLILPPIGFISWVNPIITASLIFPQYGFTGILLFIVLIYIIGLLLIQKKSQPNYFMTLVVLLLISIKINHTVIPPQENKLYPVHSNLKYSNKSIDFIGDFHRQNKLLSLANQSNHKQILFHENALGNFTQNSMMIWNQLDRDKTILAGAFIYEQSRVGRYDNVLMQITNKSHHTLYKQRVPVPISMWKPWSQQGANAYPLSNPVISYSQDRVGVFICYELLLTYTYLHTMLYQPDYMIGVSNLWWVEDNSISTIQKNSLKLWGVLFGIGSYYAENQ